MRRPGKGAACSELEGNEKIDNKKRAEVKTCD
jgi:hypothetical protein